MNDVRGDVFVGPTIRWLRLYTDNFQTLTQETAMFARDRATRSLDAIYQASNGETGPARMLEVHGQWVSQAVSDYSAQAQRMFDLCTGMVRSLSEQSATVNDAVTGAVVKPFADRQAAAGQKK